MCELLAENIRVDFFVTKLHTSTGEARHERVVERVLAGDDCRTRIEEQAPARRQVRDALLDNVQTQLGAEFAAAVAIQTGERINQIGWICDNQVELTFHRGK